MFGSPHLQEGLAHTQSSSSGRDLRGRAGSGEADPRGTQEGAVKQIEKMIPMKADPAGRAHGYKSHALDCRWVAGGKVGGTSKSLRPPSIRAWASAPTAEGVTDETPGPHVRSWPGASGLEPAFLRDSRGRLRRLAAVSAHHSLEWPQPGHGLSHRVPFRAAVGGRECTHRRPSASPSVAAGIISG